MSVRVHWFRLGLQLGCNPEQLYSMDGLARKMQGSKVREGACRMQTLSTL